MWVVCLAGAMALAPRLIAQETVAQAALAELRSDYSNTESSTAATSGSPSAEFVTGYHGHFACLMFRGISRKLAIAVSDLEFAKATDLLQSGANINARTSDSRAFGRTLLQMAVWHEWGMESDRFLIAAGADIEARDRHGDTALTLACQSDLGSHQPVVSLLLRAGANVNARGAKGMTPLMCAALHDESGQVVKTLLAASADVAARDRLGWTALMHATRKRRENIQVVRMLLAARANVRAKHEYGGTALANAALNGQTQTVRLLLSAGADVNSCDAAGWTPLICAAMNGHAQTVKLLIQAGANRNATDRLGRTALNLARFNRHPSVSELLTRNGTRQ